MPKKTLQNLLVFLLGAGLLLTACGPAAPRPAATQAPTEPSAPQPMTFVDDLGNTLEFTDYPKSIVSISPSTTEILFWVGAGNQVVGRDDFSLYPEEALAIPSVGAFWGELPTESILALEPDLVLAAQIITEDQVQALRDLGLNVYWQANPKSYDELWSNLRDIAKLTGHEAEADAKIPELQARVSTVQEKIAPLSTHPSVFYELDATDPSNPWTTGSGTFIDYILSMAGGTNAAASLQGDYAQFSAEQLISADPDIILLADAMYGVTPESVSERPGWDVITAVKNQALYPIDPNMMSVPGPRLVDALEVTAKLLHPEVFK